MPEAKYIPLTFVTSTTEKERLIRNTILLQDFAKDTEAEVPLSHYIEGTQYGFNASAKSSGSHLFVRISDIAHGEIAWNSVPFCECEKPKGYQLKDHDLLIARTGGTTGKSHMVMNPPENSVFAGYLIRIRANEETNPLFLSIFLNSYFYWGQITSLNRDEFRPSVNAKKLAALKLPKFDRSLQDKIADVGFNLEQADSSTSLNVQSVLNTKKAQEEFETEIAHQEALLGKLKQAILQEAIQGKLTESWRTTNPEVDLSTEASAKVEPASELLKRIQKEKARLIAEKKIRKEKPLPKITPEEIPFEIPDSWEWCHLIEASTQIHYGFTASSDSSRTDIRLVRITDIQDGRVDWPSVPGCICSLKELSKYRLSNGDLLIARTGGTVGKSYLVNSLTLNSVFASYLVRVVPGSPALAQYLSLFFGSPYYWGQITDAAKGAQPNVSGSKLKRLILPLPPLAEQAAIVERVDALMATCRELEAEITASKAHAEQLLQAVLKEAFSN